MLSYQVSDGKFCISRHPSVKDFFYVHFIEYNGRDYGTAFVGNLNACTIYCKERQIEYLEAEIEQIKSQKVSLFYIDQE